MKYIILKVFIFSFILGCSQSNDHLIINVWYGEEQYFGEPGMAQRWINVLGNIESENQLISLAYQLNNGQKKALSWGSDLHRLAAQGDFNIDIDTSALINGRNQVIIFAEDSVGLQARREVTVYYKHGNRWPLPYEINWSEVDQLQEAIQVVDGQWEITPDGLHNLDVYYDRVVAIGDGSWRNYEIETSIVFHSFTVPEPGPPTYNVSHAALASRWPGHDLDSLQPHRKWFPLGATSEFRITDHLDSCRWRIFDGPKPGEERFYQEQSPNQYRMIEFEKPYGMKHRVESILANGTRYSVKLWPLDQPEPAQWDFVAIEKNENIISGSALLIAHHTNVTFGNVKVVPLQP